MRMQKTMNMRLLAALFLVVVLAVSANAGPVKARGRHVHLEDMAE